MEKQKNVLALVLFGLGVALVGTIGATTLQTSLIAQQPNQTPSDGVQNPPADRGSAPEQLPPASGQVNQPNRPENIQQPPPTDGQSQFCKDFREYFAAKAKELTETIENLQKEYGVVLAPAIENAKLAVNALFNDSRGLLTNCEGATEDSLNEAKNKLEATWAKLQNAVDGFLEIKGGEAMQQALIEVQNERASNRKHLDEKGVTIKAIPENANLQLRADLKLLEVNYKEQLAIIAAIAKALKDNDTITFWKLVDKYWEGDKKFLEAINALAFKLEEVKAKLVAIAEARDRLTEITSTTCRDITASYNDTPKSQRTKLLTQFSLA